MSNYDDVIQGSRSIDATAVRSARLLLLQVGMVWSSNVKVKPGAFDPTFGRAKKTTRLVILMNQIAMTSPKAHNVRFFFLVMLGSVIRIQTQKLVKTASDVPKMLDRVRHILHSSTVPEGFESVEHVIQEALIASAVYGFRVPPEKILTISCLPIFPITNRRMVFNGPMIAPYIHAASVADHLCNEVLDCIGNIIVSK